MARIIDITLDVSAEMFTWPGDPAVRIEPVQRIARGDGANVSQVTLSTHTGTHVDPPCHFVEGAPSVDQLPLDVLCGPAVVVDTGDARRLGSEHVPLGAERVLFKTINSPRLASLREFPDDYACLSNDAAQALVAAGVRLVAIDFQSVEELGAEGHPVHMTLLSAGVVIVEGVNLAEVEPGEYTLVCLPLKVKDGDGAPARAVLIAE
ncbi:MAG TPA: cyclase family protein [Actinomycetota bacterium]|nr:cyclase family protein [Actinomycetota bacterium]